MKHPWISVLAGIMAAVVLTVGSAYPSRASTTLGPLATDYDIYVVSGAQANSNQNHTPYYDTSFYPKGGMMISAARDDTVNGVYYSTRTMETAFSFNTATNSTNSSNGLTNGIDVVSALNAQYGADKWVISSVSIKLATNYPVAGVQPNNPDFNTIAPGNFSLNVLGANPDIPTLTWNRLQPVIATGGYSSVGTFYWVATATASDPLNYYTYQLNVTPELVNALKTGKVTFLGLPEDSGVGYLFNTNTRGAPPLLTITADAAPVSRTLSVTVSGNGNVNSTPSGIACSSGTCLANFGSDSIVTLTQTPAPYSVFSGWGGSCAGTAATCDVSMTEQREVVAHFSAAPRAMMGTTGYASLNEAYAAASTTATILMLDTEIAESLHLKKGIGITLMGGYDATFTSRSGLPTVLSGVLTIGAGSLTVDSVAIK